MKTLPLPEVATDWVKIRVFWVIYILIRSVSIQNDIGMRASNSLMLGSFQGLIVPSIVAWLAYSLGIVAAIISFIVAYSLVGWLVNFNYKEDFGGSMFT